MRRNQDGNSIISNISPFNMIVLLQSGKAESASNIMMGASAELFAQRKERGSELFLSRMTLILGLLFFVICLVMSLM